MVISSTGVVPETTTTPADASAEVGAPATSPTVGHALVARTYPSPLAP